MADTIAEIPDREPFKASEVCEIAKVQPYVLRSWEQEFPHLGVARVAGGARMYRRADVELVLRIKHLVFVDGLTLAGVRRRLEGSEAAAPVPPAEVPEATDGDARDRLASIKRELRSLLDLLDGSRGDGRQVAPAASGYLDLGGDGAESGSWPSKGKAGGRKAASRKR